MNRLNRVAGQVQGIHGMIETDRYCIDILNQIHAVRAALNGVATILLEDHIEHCFHHAMEDNDHSAVQELVDTWRKFAK